ncbi:ThiF family adenylyltransferase [Kocuria aegyptia]|uniref:THIF-type NAD/FAD binding fold domain-containing protein n=1 Tax=Kocuria aegyptia TaxID=330943 RepID=A0ABN2KNN5_9MICC
MPTTPLPGPRQGPGHGPDPGLSCLERPRPDEVHVLVLGLDGLAAALAVRLLRCGVLGLYVSDPAAVTTADLGTGAYRPADVGRSREAALRRRLRELDPRCAPVSAPELFPGALLPGTVVVHSAAHPASAPAGRVLPGAAAPEAWAGIDPRHPVVSLHHADGVLLRWPTVPWAHRPCPDCVGATLGGGQPGEAPRGRAAVLAAWAAPAHAEAVAVRLAVEVLAVALASLCGADGREGGSAARDGARHAALYAPPWPDAVSWLRLDRSRCLCGLDQE